jgi:GAF domain-containing protein
MAAFRELRREMSYCTHTVSGEGPLVVENALEEPFFRGNKAVTRFGMASYVGVPLRTTTGMIVGTLCALSATPHAVAPETVALMEVLARRALAEIERERTPALLRDLVEVSSGSADVYSEAFFRDLVAAERARTSSARSSWLITMRAESAMIVLDWIEAHETAGRIATTDFGLLLPGVSAEAAAARVARLPAIAAARAVPLASTQARPGPDVA